MPLAAALLGQSAARGGEHAAAQPLHSPGTHHGDDAPPIHAHPLLTPLPLSTASSAETPPPPPIGRLNHVELLCPRRNYGVVTRDGLGRASENDGRSRSLTSEGSAFINAGETTRTAHHDANGTSPLTPLRMRMIAGDITLARQSPPRPAPVPFARDGKIPVPGDREHIPDHALLSPILAGSVADFYFLTPLY